MSFDEFADQVEFQLMEILGLTEIQVADFISPRTIRMIQLYQEGVSVEKAANTLKSTPPVKQNWD